MPSWPEGWCRSWQSIGYCTACLSHVSVHLSRMNAVKAVGISPFFSAQQCSLWILLISYPTFNILQFIVFNSVDFDRHHPLGFPNCLRLRLKTEMFEENISQLWLCKRWNLPVAVGPIWFGRLPNRKFRPLKDGYSEKTHGVLFPTCNCGCPSLKKFLVAVASIVAANPRKPTDASWDPGLPNTTWFIHSIDLQRGDTNF